MLSTRQALVGFLLTAAGAIAGTAPPKPTWTPACPGKECPDLPDASKPEYECIVGCYNDVVAGPEFGCNTVEDWNCVCARHNTIYSRARPCAQACGSPELYEEFWRGKAKGCTCVKATCPAVPSSTTTPVPPSSSTTPAPSSSITPGPECPHPCSSAISAVPACATDCIKSGASAVGCGGDDYSCRCASATAIQSVVLGCVVGACGFDEALKVQGAVKVVCDCASASPATPCDNGPTSTPGSSNPPSSTGSGGPSGGVTHITKTIGETTTICVTETPKPSCTKGPDGKPCDDDSDDEGSDGEDSDDDESDCEGGCHGGPKPSGSGGPKPSGTGGGSGPKPTKTGGDGGSGPKPTKTGGDGGSGPKPTKPPVTAGASGVVMVGTGCLAGIIAAVVAFM